MKLRRVVVLSFVVLSSRFAFGTQDPSWMFADSVNVIFTRFFCYDTSRTGLDFNRFSPVDTGASYDGSPYINFNYQFTTDSLIVTDPYDPATVMYRDWRPGYAGFKTAWDDGMTGYNLARYKYLILAHKGLLSTHKATIKFWYNGGSCGDSSFIETIGSFAASSEWKVDTLIVPEIIRSKADKARNSSIFYEMVVIINNADPLDPNKTSGPGCLKLDNIRLAGCNPIDTSPKSQNVPEGAPVVLKVWTTLASSTDNLTYQWKKDGVDIAGETASTLTLASAKSGDAGVYTVAVTVSSTQLSFISQGATITVEAAAAKEKEGCGCGAGTAAAFIPPLWFKARANRRRKKLARQA